MPRRLTYNDLSELPPRFRAQAVEQLRTRRASRSAAPEPDVPTLFRRCGHVGCRSHDACVRPGRYELVIPGRAVTTNRFISPLFIGSPDARAARTAEVGRRYKEVKQAAYAMAIHERIPTLARGLFSVQAIYTSRLPDAGGLAVVGKAILDGLVEAGVFVDDGPSVIGGEWYPAPVRDDAGDRLVVRVAANVSPDATVFSWGNVPSPHKGE